jgi:4-hydroxy-4-methyl-2-oxoglutarate aldolase
VTVTAERLTDDVIDRLATLGSATLYEAASRDCALNPRVRPMWTGARIVGRALPVRTHPADNLALHRAVSASQPGNVLVVDGRGELCGYWGEVLAVAAQSAGIAGLVIDGGVRDLAALREMQFPVFAVGAAIHRTGKHWPGRIGVPVEVADVLVSPGDVVVADEDGVVILPLLSVDEVLSASELRTEQEARYMQQLRQGKSTLEVYGFPAQ